MKRQLVHFGLPLLFLAAPAVFAQSTSPQLIASCPGNSVNPGDPVSASFTVTNSSGNFFSWTFSAPPGFTLNANGGSATVSGIAPATPGDYSIQAAAASDVTTIGPSQCTFTVVNPPPPVTVEASCPVNPFNSGSPVSVSFSAINLPPSTFTNFSWTLTSAPPGFKLQSAGGSATVSGNAPAAAGSYTISVSGTYLPNGPTGGGVSAGNASCTFTVVIPPPPVTVSGNCPSTAFNSRAPVSVSFFAVNLPQSSSPNFSWTLASAPPGFRLQQAGGSATVSGIAPDAPGSYTITVSGTYFPNGPSGGGVSAGSASCTFTVQSLRTLTLEGSCPVGPFSPGMSISVPLSASGGSGNYLWGISSQGAAFGLSATSNASTIVSGKLGTTLASFTVTLTDPESSSPSQTLSCTLPVTSPTLTIEGACPTTSFAAGSPVTLPYSATGGTGPYTWQVSAGNSGLALSSPSGASTALQGTAPAAGTYSFTVTVTDAAEHTATFTCSIIVVAPVQISGACPAQAVAAGAPFSLPLSVSGGSGTYTWSVTGPFTPSSTTGKSITLSGTPSTAGTFDVTVTVHDSSGAPAGTFNCTIKVVAALTITGPPCPTASLIAGRAFSASLTAAGGSGNFTWSLSGPGFLSLSSNSGASITVSGTPPNAGTFPFSVSVTDSSNTPLSAPYSCSLQVTSPLTLNPATLPDGIVDQPYPGATLSATGGTSPLTFSVSGGALPPGLQLSSSGAISGTPTQTGNFGFTVTVTDSGAGSARQTASGNFQIAVASNLTNTTTCPLPVGRELESYSAPLTATGGSGQYIFSLANNSLLPPGLTLNQNTITGTPEGPSDTTLNFVLSSGSQSITFNCELKVMGRVPNVTVNGFFVSVGSSLLTSTVALDAPVQQDVTGTATLTFTPDVPNSAITDNPQVQFCGGNATDPLCGGAQTDTNGLLRSLPFTIPAGTQSVDLSPISQSNVAGTIQVTLTNVTMGGQSITVAPLTFTIPRTPPEILATPTFTLSGKTLTFSMKVSSSTCELSSASTIFTPTPGSELLGGGGGAFTAVIDLTSVFKSFVPFAIDATHPTGGCAFTLTLPFTIDGDPRAIQKVSITLSSSAGAAPPVSLGLQP